MQTIRSARSEQRQLGQQQLALPWLVIAIASLIGASVLTLALLNGIEIPGDKTLLASALMAGSWKGLWDLLSFVGDYPMIPLGLGFVAWLYWTKRRREALLVFVILVAATISSEAVKAIVARPRPTGPVPGIPGVVYSFPSGHALEDVMIMGMVSVRLWRSEQAQWLKLAVAVLSTILVLLIGFARLALNVHYPSDVLGGFLGGLFFLGWYAWGSRMGAWASHPGPIRAGHRVAG